MSKLLYFCFIIFILKYSEKEIKIRGGRALFRLSSGIPENSYLAVGNWSLWNKYMTLSLPEYYYYLQEDLHLILCEYETSVVITLIAGGI